MRVANIWRMRTARSDTSSVAEEMSQMIMAATTRASEVSGEGLMDLGDNQGSTTGG